MGFWEPVFDDREFQNADEVLDFRRCFHLYQYHLPLKKKTDLNRETIPSQKIRQHIERSP